MKIIDAHMHLSNIETFHETAEYANIDYSQEGLLKEYQEHNVVLGIGMGLEETNVGAFPDYKAKSPMGLDLCRNSPKFVYCLGVNPYTINKKSLKQIRVKLEQQEVVGLKVYLGYYPFYANDVVYAPIYKIAKEFNVPVVFHTGDTYSDRGLLKYAHPLQLDELAVRNRDMTIVMAHLGDPWVLDGAEVVYKNVNVYADLSGICVGPNINRQLNNGSFDHLKHAIRFCDHYERLIFGTDWPIASIGAYIEFIKYFIPEEHYKAVFYENAIKVFTKIKPFL